MLSASPLFGLLSDRIGRVPTPRILAVAGVLGCSPAFAGLNGDAGPQVAAQLLGVLLVCAWAAAAITSFPRGRPTHGPLVVVEDFRGRGAGILHAGRTIRVGQWPCDRSTRF